MLYLFLLLLTSLSLPLSLLFPPASSWRSSSPGFSKKGIVSRLCDSECSQLFSQWSAAARAVKLRKSGLAFRLSPPAYFVMAHSARREVHSISHLELEMERAARCLSKSIFWMQICGRVTFCGSCLIKSPWMYDRHT